MAFKKKESRLEFPIEAMTQNFLFTTTQDVWVGYKINHQVFPLNDLEFFNEYIEDGKGIFQHDAYEYHFMNIPKTFELDTHIEKTIRELVKGDFADLGEIYFNEAGKIIKDEVQMNKHTTYLFVRLTTPILAADPFEYVELIKDGLAKFVNKLTGMRVPTSKLLSTYRQAEEQLFNDLTNYKQIERLDPVEMGRLFYHFFHRANTHSPQRELLVEEMTEGVLENNSGYLTIEQLDKTHYLALEAVVGLPTSMYGSSIIQNIQDSVSFPLETHVIVSFQHKKKDAKTVHKMRKRLFEQDKEQDQVDGILNDDEVVLFGEERLRDLNDKMKTGERRVCRSTITFIVATDNKEELEEWVSELDYVLESSDYKIYRPIVDQLTLFNQCLVGSNKTFKSFEQVVTTGYIADLGLDLNKEIGNNYGIPIGRVITSKKYKSVDIALRLSSKIVWFFPSLTKKAIAGALHQNGNTLITGPPGKGKSVLVKYIFLWLTFLGQKILYIDPKNETELFFRKAVEKFHYIPEFVELYNRINFISLSKEEKYRGMLDPLLFLPYEEAIETARSVLENLGQVNTDNQTANAKKTVILNSVKTVMKGRGKKHLTKVIEVIREKDEELATLISGFNDTLAKILIGNDYSDPLKFSSQINVLGTEGLHIPTQKEIDRGKLNNAQISGMAIMEVITKTIDIFSTDKSEDAAVFFDEAKGYEDTAQGKYLIDSILRKGRANMTDVYLVTQAFMDFNKEDVKELISYKFAFRPNQKEAQKNVLDFFGMEDNGANLQMMSELKQGTCLFQDHLGRNQPIAIDVLFDSWLMAISSTDKEDEATKRALELEQSG